MKLYRNAIILVVVLGLLIGASFIMKNKAPANGSGAQSASTAADTSVKIWNLDKAKIAEITIDNKGQKFIFTKKDKNLALSQPVIDKADTGKVDAIASQVAGLSADKVVQDNASNLGEYGLDNPIEVSVKMDDGTVKVLDIGNQTPTQDGYYAKEKDKNKIYRLAPYAAEIFIVKTMDFMDKTLFTGKQAEDITGLTLERGGKLVFSSKLVSTDSWELTAPIQGEANGTSIGPMLNAISQLAISDYKELNATNLDKYGLKDPAYAITYTTKNTTKKILLGLEVEKGKTVYAKLADNNNVFTVDESNLTFLDIPLKEVISPFAYIVNINNVDRITLNMDGKTVDCGLITTKDKPDQDKFTVNGKAANMKDKDDKQIFRNFYEALVGVTLSNVEMGDKPQGKVADITITYYLNKAPGKMVVEFIPKDANNYYVVRNGVYSNLVVEKSTFDEKVGVRDTLKKLMDAVNAEKK